MSEIGAVLGGVSDRLQPVVVAILAIGLLAAVVTDGSVPALVTRGLLAAMALPTAALAMWLTRSAES